MRARWYPHVAPIALLLLIATAYHAFCWKGISPYPLLESDAANIASMVAATDHPELFRNDPVFGHPENFRFYTSVLLPYVRYAARVTGDYGVAFMQLVGPLTLLQGLGFYVLGLVLFGSRFWAIILALATMARVPLEPFNFWGLFENPLPRIAFQSALPFLLAAAIRWREEPRAWPWLMAGAGALVYVHPVSAPAWGLALWAGLWLHRPAEWSPRKRVAVMVGLGAIFVAAALPFTLRYLGPRVLSEPAPYEQVYAISRERFARGFFELEPGLIAVAKGLLKNLLLPLGALGLFLALRRRETRPAAAQLCVWLSALFVLSAVVPVIEQRVCAAIGMMPLEVDLVRNVRYLVPLLLAGVLWIPALLSAEGGLPLRRSLAVIGLVGLGFWVARYPPIHARDRQDLQGLSRAGQTRAGERELLREALIALRARTAPGDRILPAKGLLAVRYFALRPLVFSRKDGGILAYANQRELLRWNETWQLVKAAEAVLEPGARLRRWMALGRQLNADYVLLDVDARGLTPAPEGAVLEYANANWSLLRLPPRQ